MSLHKKYSDANPAYCIRPGMRFVFSHPAHAVALFFGVGLMRPGPGTWGTAAGVLVWAMMVQVLPLSALTTIIAAVFALGVWASQKTSEDLGVEDAGCIVIDEVVAVWLVCLMFPQTPAAWAASFIAFRLFDIVKLPPAAYVDEHLHNGFGVMLDDVLAAVWAVLSLVVFDWAVAGLSSGAVHVIGVF